MSALLAPDEGPAVEIREGGGPFVVVCEHASNRIPRSLGTLGLAPSDLERHIAWDLGAVAVASRLTTSLGGDLVVQRFSRLAIDCNRDPTDSDAFVTISEDTVVPGNADLGDLEKAQRVAELWTPFHDALTDLLDARIRAGRPTALVTIHSFTPVYRGVPRPWHIGVISTDERDLADTLLRTLRRDTALIVGDNEPYSAKDRVDYTIRRHGRDRGIAHVMIEIRNDLVSDARGQAEWADRLAHEFGALHMAVNA